jgi:hypothetical protein
VRYFNFRNAFFPCNPKSHFVLFFQAEESHRTCFYHSTQKTHGSQFPKTHVPDVAQVAAEDSASG